MSIQGNPLQPALEEERRRAIWLNLAHAVSLSGKTKHLEAWGKWTSKPKSCKNVWGKFQGRVEKDWGTCVKLNVEKDDGEEAHQLYSSWREPCPVGSPAVSISGNTTWFIGRRQWGSWEVERQNIKHFLEDLAELYSPPHWYPTKSNWFLSLSGHFLHNPRSLRGLDWGPGVYSSSATVTTCAYTELHTYQLWGSGGSKGSAQCWGCSPSSSWHSLCPQEPSACPDFTSLEVPYCLPWEALSAFRV